MLKIYWVILVLLPTIGTGIPVESDPDTKDVNTEVQFGKPSVPGPTKPKEFLGGLGDIFSSFGGGKKKSEASTGEGGEASPDSGDGGASPFGDIFGSIMGLFGSLGGGGGGEGGDGDAEGGGDMFGSLLGSIMSMIGGK